MTLPKKGFRKITVNGDTFLWRARKKITHNEGHNDPIAIPIQYSAGGQILMAQIAFTRSGYDHYLLSEVTPSLIRACIKKGIAQGWQYKQQGSLFELDCRDIQPKSHINRILSPEYFIKHGSFYFDNRYLPALYKHADTQFGQDIIMLSLKFIGYDVAIIVDKIKEKIKSCQIENFNHEYIEDDFLSSIANYKALLSHDSVSKLVDEVYQDDVETVIFLNTGAMLYYNKVQQKQNNWCLSLIVENHEASKKLVRGTLPRIV